MRAVAILLPLLALAPLPLMAGDSAHRISLADDNQFYVTAQVNGAAIRFVVDTGASIVVLRPDDARRAGLARRPGDYTQEADSAAGTIALAPVTIRHLAVGTHLAHDVEAAVGDDMMDVSLLGMSYLARAGRITIENGRLTIGG